MSPVEFEQRYIELLGELKAEGRHLYDYHRDHEESDYHDIKGYLSDKKSKSLV